MIALASAGLGCHSRNEGEAAQPAWCIRSDPFCELDKEKVPYYYHIREDNVRIYSVKKHLRYEVKMLVQYFRTARKCYPKYFEEKFNEKPDLVDNGPIYIMIVDYQHLNGKEPIIDSTYSRDGEDICALTKCTKCDPVWRVWDRRSTIYTAEVCLGVRNISHETFHQMICRTTNWFDVEKRFSKGSTFFEESLARDFENYHCLYEGALK